MALDIEGSTSMTNPVKLRIRHRTYEVFGTALDAAGIREFCDPLTDRGDGLLALLQPADAAPKTLVLNTVMPVLGKLLADEEFRLRAAVHAGEVHIDRYGPFGEAVDVTCRLLDAPRTKRALRMASAPLVVVVSDEIYRSVVCHGYSGIDRLAFATCTRVRVGGRSYQGWVRPVLRSVPMREENATSPVSVRRLS